MITSGLPYASVDITEYRSAKNRLNRVANVLSVTIGTFGLLSLALLYLPSYLGTDGITTVHRGIFVLVFLSLGASSAVVTLKKKRLWTHYERNVHEEVQRRAADTSFTERLGELTANLENSQRLIEELTAEVSLRKARLEELNHDAEEKARLAALNADQAAAVDQRISEHIYTATSELLRENRRDGRQSLLLGGVVIAFLVGIGVNYVFMWMTT